MLADFWRNVRALLDDEPQKAPLYEAISDLFITDRSRIAELLEEMRRAGIEVTLQGAEGHYLGHARLYEVGDAEVTFRVHFRDGPSALASRHRANAVGSTTHGAVMFTVELHRSVLGDLWQAPLPTEAMCVQSRRHRRVTTVRTQHHQALLQLPSSLTRQARLLDLSEEGAGLEVDQPVRPDDLAGMDAELLLDGQVRLRIPWLAVAYVGKSQGRGSRVGLGLNGMNAADQRTLARWLNAAEVAGREAEAEMDAMPRASVGRMKPRA